MKHLSVALLAGVLGAIGPFAVSASAQVVDPTTFHVGTGAGTTCATGAQGCEFGTGSINGEVNLIGNTFDIYQNSNSAQDNPDAPLEIIFATPHGDVFPATSSWSATLYPSYSFPPLSGGTSSVTLTNPPDDYGFSVSSQGTFSSGNLYTYLAGRTMDPAANGALIAGDNSLSIGNFNTAEDQKFGSHPSGGYDIYLLEAEVNLNSQDLLNIVSSGLPQGTFVAAFAEQASKCPPNGTAAQCAPVVVPFTQVGLTTTNNGGSGSGGALPEPGSLILLGTALAGLGLLGRRYVKMGLGA